MKKYFPVIIVLFSIYFSGCVKDSVYQRHSYIFYMPVYESKEVVKANIKSNPAKEVQHPGKIYLYGKYIFLNEIDKGIHVIDNSDPASPRNIAFIDIPGNLDIAVKGNALYADLYTDLVTIDITDPLHASLKKYTNNVFPFRNYSNGVIFDSTKVIIDWIKSDRFISEGDIPDNWWKEKNTGGIFFQNGFLSTGGTPAPVGIGGSMARFTLVNDRLYTVSTYDLKIFNVLTPSDPVFSKKLNLGWGIETIYPLKDNLFIGSQTGMFIYSISNPDNPVQAGQFIHTRSCDPVIADDNYAYVTLRSGTTCQGFSNQLDVVQLNNLSNSSLVKSYSLTNPHGLSKDGNLLFVCDGTDGLKIFDVSDVTQIKLIKHFTGIETYDVIAYKNIALVVAKDALYQFNYTNTNHIRQLSKIDIVK